MRVGGGGGSTVVIKNMPVTQCAVTGYGTAEIERLCAGLQPAAMAEAGRAFTAAAATLAAVAEGLVQHAQRLSESWTGTAAQTALGSFRQLHESAVELAQASSQTGSVLTWLGDPILPYYRSYRAPANGIVGDLEAFFGHNPQQAAAQQHLSRLNDRLAQANGGLPDSVSVNLPAASVGAGTLNAVRSGVGGPGGGLAGPGAGSGPGAGPVTATGSAGTGARGSGGGGAGGGSGVGSGSGGGAPGPGPGPFPRLTPPPVPGGGGGGLPPGGGPGPGGGWPGGVLPALGGGMAVGAVGAGGAGVLRGTVSADSGLGAAANDTAQVGPDGMVGSLQDSGGAGASAEPGVAPAGTEGMPVAGGAGGDRERERMRLSWMGEDPALWDDQPGTVPPTVGT